MNFPDVSGACRKVFLMLLESIFDFSEKFPEINMKTSSLKGYPEVNEKKYVCMSLFVSFLISFFVFIVFVFQSILNGVASALFSFAFVFFFLLKLPDAEKRKENSRIESELPFIMRNLGLLLDMGIPFQKALKIVSEDEGVAADRFRDIVEDIEKGGSAIRSLSGFAEKTENTSVKRAIAQLMAVYEHGGKGNEVKRIGDELLLMQQHRMKDYASKSALFGLLFIAVSAILPTFLVIFSTIGEFAFNMKVDVIMVLFGFFVGIPLLSLLVLLVSKISMPSYAFSKEKKIELSVLLLGVLFFATTFFPGPPYNYFFIVIGVFVFSGMNYKKYLKEKKVEEVEADLPDALLAASGLPKGSRIDRVFSVMEKSGGNELSKEAEISIKQLKSNVKPEKVIMDFQERNPSPVIKRACSMLENALNTNALWVLHEMAEDILKFFEVKRERENLLGMQKYTLIAGGIILPLILKTSLNLVENISEFVESGEGMVEILYGAIPGYLIVYAILASYYVTDLEGKPSRSLLYFGVLSVVGLLIFSFVSI